MPVVYTIGDRWDFDYFLRAISNTVGQLRCFHRSIVGISGMLRVVLELALKERREEKVGLQMAKLKAGKPVGFKLTLAASKSDKR